MSEAPPPHAALMREAVRADGEAYRALLAGDAAAARRHLGEAVERYRASWRQAPPRSYGRLVAALKSAVIAGGGADVAEEVRREVTAGDSPTACYALAVAALVVGDDAAVAPLAAGMRAGDPPFRRAGDALEAIAARDAAGYGAAVRAIVDDFAARDAHLTGVPIADTAVLLEHLAADRGMAARPASPLMPPA